MENKYNDDAINSNETALIPTTDNAIISDFTNASSGMYCSFVPQTADEKALLYNAMNAPDVKIADHIGQEIVVTDVIIEPVQIVDDKTGEVRTSPRVILIDEEGHTYSAVSYGLYNAVKRMVQIFDYPSWKPGIPVRVKQLTRGSYRIFTLDIVRR